MQSSEKAADPSMEEILASIRKIISEEPDAPPSSADGRAATKAAPAAPPTRPVIPSASAPSPAAQDDDDLSDILDQSTERLKPFGRRAAPEDNARAAPPKLEAMPMSGRSSQPTQPAVPTQPESPFGLPLPRSSHAPATPPLPKIDPPSSGDAVLPGTEVRKPAIEDGVQAAPARTSQTSGADDKGDDGGFTLADRLRGLGRTRPNSSDEPTTTTTPRARVTEPSQPPPFEPPPTPEFPSLTKLKADMQADPQTSGGAQPAFPASSMPLVSTRTAFGDRPEAPRPFEPKARERVPAPSVEVAEVELDGTGSTPPYSDADPGDRWASNAAKTSANTSFDDLAPDEDHTRPPEWDEPRDPPRVAKFSRHEAEPASDYASTATQPSVREPEFRQTADDDFDDLWLDEPSNETPETRPPKDDNADEWRDTSEAIASAAPSIASAAPSAASASSLASSLTALAVPSSKPGSQSEATTPGEPAVRTLEDTVSELLRPLLREWLDANMPRIVEKALRVELAERGLGASEKDSSPAG